MITFDAGSEQSNGSGASTNWNHTTGSGNSRILMISVVTQTSGGDEVSAVTVGGSAATLVDRQSGGIGEKFESSLWYFINPPLGIVNVAVTFTGSVAFACGAASFFGVKTSDPINVSNKATNTTGDPTVSATTTKDNCMMVDSMYTASAVELNPSESGQTKVWTGLVPAPGDSGGQSYRSVTTAGAYSMTWITGGANSFTIVSAGLNPKITRGGAVLMGML